MKQQILLNTKQLFCEIKNILTTIILFFIVNTGLAQIEIPAGNVSGTWIETSSPYNINGEITIADATTLTIEPGVVVEFQGHYKLIVEGVLLAIGTETDTIEFTVNDTTGLSNTEITDGGWHGIRFINNTSVDSSKIVYCKIQYGKATDGDSGTGIEDDKGGAIYNNSFSKLLIENCLIDNNIASYYGGGIYNYESAIIINKNIISNNNSEWEGGGIECRGVNYEADNATISNNEIKNNYAKVYGGGIYYERAKCKILGNTITKNESGADGGGIFQGSYAGGLIVSNKIINNTSYYGGGICISQSRYPVLQNNIISNNYATHNYGGGIEATNYTGQLKIINNTITNNQGQGIYAGESIIVQNSIIWGNSTQIVTAGTVTVNYCDIEGGYSGTGNINIDPQFTNPSSGIGIQEDALNADWSLPPVSFAANAGTPDTTGLNLPETDIIGNNRVYGKVIDMGAYELKQPIERSGTITDNTIWNADTINITGDIIINDGITLTISDSTVINFTGHYEINVQGCLKAIGAETDTIFFTYNDTAGFSDNSTNDGGWHGIRFENTPATNDSSKLVYCKFEFGKANSGAIAADSSGGAIFANNASKLLIQNSVFKNNFAWYGGAISLYQASPKIIYTTFYKNTGDNASGINCSHSSSPEISQNIFSNNISLSYCGAINASYSSNPIINNNIICNNESGLGAGISFFESSSPTLYNNTIVNNSSTNYGGGIYCSTNSSPIFKNTIIYGNTSASGNQVYIDDNDSDPDFIYCDIEGGLGALGIDGEATYDGSYENNYDFTPAFVNPTSGAGKDYDGITADWSLWGSSSILNAGDPNQTGIPTEDFEGNPRVYNGIIDIGAHELQQARSICGNWIEDSYWAGDTIKVVCETIIDPGVTVTINPGTVIEFTDYYKLIVQGVLLAEGTETDSITFTTNDIATGWHGIRFDGNSPIDTSKFSFCKFEYGKATGTYPDELGGAMYVNTFDLIHIENSLFINNSATGGGAIYLENASPVIIGNKFINNNGGNFYGGAISCAGGNSSIINNLFTNNSADKGGALSINSNVVITNNTIANNHATTYGGGIYFDNTYTGNIKNCIIYGNTSDGNQIYLYDDLSDPDFTNCNIEGGAADFGLYTAVTYDGTYTNNIDSDPKFTNPSSGAGNQADAFSSDWTLKDISPCINVGTDTTGLNLPLVDIAGNPRVINDIIDMGAYESLVAFECGNITSNTTWDADTVKVNCDITIDDAYTLTIVPGTYVEFQGHYKIDVQGRLLAEGTPTDSIIFTINDTTGFADTSIVNGGWASIWFDETPTSNDTSKFAYCNFEYGKASTESSQKAGGAVIVNLVSKLIIENSVFKNNMASGSYSCGGAVYITNTSAPFIRNCLFFENIVKGPYYGGGGAICISSSSPTINNNKFFNNVADSSSGGAIYCKDGSNPQIVNNLFANNYARFGGAVMFAMSTSPTVYNNTIAYNKSKIGGGFAFYENCNPLIQNNILYANTDSAGGAQVYFYDNASQPDFSYNNIQGGSVGFDMPDTVTYTGNYLNNIDENPLFISPTAGAGIEYDGSVADWTLQGNNPCINAGTPDTTGMNIPQLDLAQNTRVYNDVRIDIGAYEYLNNPPEINTQTFNIDENSYNSTVVATATASDIDGNENSFSITGGNTNGAFAINNSGQITVANTVELNYETVPQQKFDLTIQIADNGIGNLTDTTIITININDVNDAPVIDPFSFDIDENSNNSSIVGAVSGTDEDAPDQALSYSIIGGTYAANFAINSSSGEITVVDSTPLNFETNPIITITVQIQDDGTGGLTDNATVTINLNDVNDNPVIANQSFSINEQNPATTTIGTVTATDVDDPTQNLSYAIVAGNDNNAFSIIPATGELQVSTADSVDYELAISQIITIEVTDDGLGNLTNTADITVNINNINDNAPVFEDTEASFSEFSSETDIVIEFITTDVDELGGFTYSIVSGNENNIFYLQNGNGNRLYFSSNGFQNYLNYEDYQSFDLVIAVSDGDSIVEANVTINIIDINESPQIGAFAFSVNEMEANNTLIGTISGTDPDIGQNLYYFINYGNHNNAFILDSVTGELRVLDSTKLDHEGNYPSYNLEIKARDDGEPNYYAINNVPVAVNDVNEAPVVDPQTFSVNENTNPNSTFATVIATHEDDGQTLSYSIITGNEGNTFVMDVTSGQISTANIELLNYETNPVFEFMVKVQDNSAEQLSDTALITINVADINEPPVFELEEYTFTIDENTTYPTVIATVLANDPENDNISYYFDTQNMYPPFYVDNNTGEIKAFTTDSIDFEYRNQFIYTIVAQGSNYQKGYSKVTINLNDVNEAPLVSHSDFYVQENQPLNYVVGIVEANTDTGESVAFSITSGNSHSVFDINSETGEIFVSNPDTLNYEYIGYFELTVRATDNSTEALWGENIISIYVSNINDAPRMNSQTIYFLHDPNLNPYIGNVYATDDDQDMISFYIEDGNINNTFILDASSGELSVQYPDEIDASITPVYNLIVRAEDWELSDTAIITISLVPNNIDIFNLEEIVTIYPNPAQDYIFMDFKDFVNDFMISIYDEKNQVIYQNTFSNSNKDNIQKIDLSGFSKGLYFIKAQCDNKNYTGKIILK